MSSSINLSRCRYSADLWRQAVLDDTYNLLQCPSEDFLIQDCSELQGVTIEEMPARVSAF